jgi:hypothetical protein
MSPIQVAARGLRRESAAACLLGLRVRIPPGVWIFLVRVSGCLCDVPVSLPGKSYRVQVCVCVCV